MNLPARFISRMLIGLAILVTTFSVKSQNADSIVSKLIDYHYQTPQEKIYLQTDKEVYIQDETLWFSAYLVDAITHLPSGLSTLVYVDLLNPIDSVIYSLPIKMEDALGKGNILLEKSLGEGTYTIRAYTHYMRNFSPDYFFSKPIKLLKFSDEELAPVKTELNSNLDIQLFPEGGYLINGIPNVVAFRVVNEKGIGVSMSAKLTDNDGLSITEFETSRFGMGKFQFTPESGKKYIAVFENSGVIFQKGLPSGKDDGYQLSIRQNTLKTYITVKGTPGMSFDDSYVVCHVRGQVITALAATPGNDFIYSALPNDQIPSGILHITFFNNNEPLLERLVYIENDQQKINVESEITSEVKRRDKVSFDLSVSDVNASLMNGNISVSVQKSSEIKNAVNIENYLLVSSDLSGTIEHPEYYTNLENEDRFEIIDLVMLTHGWRRFDWEKVLNNQLPPINYYPEKGFTVEGQVVKYGFRNKAVEIDLMLTIAENMAFRLESRTQPDGTFWFEGLQIEDSITLVIQTIKEKQRKKDQIQKDASTLVNINPKTTPAKVKKFPDTFGDKSDYEEYVDFMLELAQIRASFEGDVVILDAFEVKARRDRSEEPYYRPSQLYTAPDIRIMLDSIPGVQRFTNVFDVMRGRTPGVEILGAFPEQTAVIRGMSTIMGSNSAMFVVDGLPAEASLVNSINPQTISHIDVLKGSKGAMYGTYNGVIAIYTKTGPGGYVDQDPMGFRMIQHFGYHRPSEFYVPKYDIMTAEEKIKPDFRSTQYWNPNVKIENGEGSFGYFTSDDKGEFIVYIEGITNDGRIIRSSLNFNVN